MDAMVYARDGYAYLYQHARGTFTSEGSFNIFQQEKNDGYDAVEWAAKQSWSNGDVGVRGPSYMGATTWQATISSPPSLKAASVSISSEDYHREWVYENGIPNHIMNIGWPEAAFTPDQIIRQEEAMGTAQEDIDNLVAQRQQLAGANMWSDWVWQLPLTSLTVFDGYIDSYADWLNHPTYDDFWQRLDVGASIMDVQVPVYIHGAWYDIFGNGSLESFISMRQGASSAAAREATKLIMTPYGHAIDNQTPSFGAPQGGWTPTPVPASDFNSHVPYDMGYFDKHLKGLDNGFESQAAARLYVMVPPDDGTDGSNFLFESDSYPVNGTDYQPYYLASDGDANNRDGSGALQTATETRDAAIGSNAEVNTASFAADLFQYDPLNPVPTTGGNLSWFRHPQAPKSGAVEQADVEVRDDVLVYTSAPLTEDLVVIGPVSVQLFAKSSALDTDFTAKLVDVRPDGQTHNILDSAVRASLRDGSKSTPSLIEPDRTYEYTINMGHTGVVFPAGHKIRLQISSSNFPKLARNLNTGQSNETTADTVIADQVILHDASHPSRLILPVVSGVTVPE